MSHKVTVVVAAAAALGAMLLASPDADADVSNGCWYHLSQHVGTTAAADVRYHRERGEFSPCNEKEAEEVDRQRSSSPSTSEDKDDDSHRPVFDHPGYGCKWTLSGRKCG